MTDISIQERAAARGYTPKRIEIEAFIQERATARRYTMGALRGVMVERYPEASSLVVGLIFKNLVADGLLVRANLGHSAPKWKWRPTP